LIAPLGAAAPGKRASARRAAKCAVLLAKSVGVACRGGKQRRACRVAASVLEHRALG